MEIARDAEVICRILEVAERRKETNCAVKRTGTHKRPHVRLDELDCQISGSRRLARSCQVGHGSVYAGHRKTSPRELKRMTPDAATQIQHDRSGSEPQQRYELLDLRTCGCHPHICEHVRSERLPEDVIFIPGFRHDIRDGAGGSALLMRRFSIPRETYSSRRRSITTGIPFDGASVMFLLTTFGRYPLAHLRSVRLNTLARTTFISIRANDIPMHRRIPPPNGKYSYGLDLVS